MTADRPFTDTEYARAAAIGKRVALADSIGHEDNRDSFRDRVHDKAFSEALDLFDEVAAVDISDAVDEGIEEGYTALLDEHYEQLDEEHACPVCDGPGELLGTLGTRDHYRCRDCGLGYS